MQRMNFDLADLRAFILVAEHANFSSAAQELHLSPSALSRRIDRLENAVGVRLFERSTRKVALTQMGREFIRKARETIHGLEETMMSMRGFAEKMRGEVTIACVPTAVRYFLPQVLQTYHRQYPHILVRIIDEGATDALASVARNEADFGLNYIGTQEPELDFEPVLKDPYVLACRKEHPLARRKKVSWAELAEHDYLTVTKGSGNRIILDQALTDLTQRPRWFCEVRHVLSVIGFVEAGLGIAAVPGLAMPPASHPDLVSIPLVEPAIARTIGLVRLRGRQLPPAAQQLYDMILGMRKIPPARGRKRNLPAS